MNDDSLTKSNNFININGGNELQCILFDRILQSKSLTGLLVKGDVSIDDIYNSVCILDELLQITINDAERIQIQV